MGSPLPESSFVGLNVFVDVEENWFDGPVSYADEEKKKKVKEAAMRNFGKNGDTCKLTDPQTLYNISEALLNAVVEASLLAATSPFSDAVVVGRSLVPQLYTHLLAASPEKNAGDELPTSCGLPQDTMSLAKLKQQIDRFVNEKRGILTSLFTGKTAPEKLYSLKEKFVLQEVWPESDRRELARKLIYIYDGGGMAHCLETFASVEEKEEHQAYRCDFRPIPCVNLGCSEVCSSKNYEKHQEKCEYLVVHCPQNCGISMARRRLKYHAARECIMRPAICPFKKYGCSFECTMHSLQDHVTNASSYHLELVCERIETDGEKLHGVEATIQNLENALSGTKKAHTLKVEELEKTCKSLDKTVAQQNARILLLEKEMKRLKG